MPALDRHDDVFILDFGDTENRFHPDWIASVNAALTEVEKGTGPRALVTTATGKFYSNGLDLEWMRPTPASLASTALRSRSFSPACCPSRSSR
jgi:Delta3-Delta2-enoyl-CoA isomerase